MPSILIDATRLLERVAELAVEIRRDSRAGARVHFVAVLRGAFVFVADLMRAYDGDVTCDFMAVSSYGDGRMSSGEVRLTKDLDESLEGRDVVIVEDIVDSGHTLSYLQRLLGQRRPRSLRTVALLDKRSRREVEVPIDYVGFQIDDRFVVGYGLDCDGRYRNLPYVGVMDDDC